METLIGNMVGYVQVSPPGGLQVRFSIGAGDRQALQPPASPSIPVTNTTVLSLFNQLGLTYPIILTDHQNVNMHCNRSATLTALAAH
ncbi:Myotubularin-related protein 13 [Portunus trituberculatus]|uniref:Myotubularin-related protein 13 n=1 Tax=Portunus trituberculatus TaxID=210409 RepID=A0A5B7EFN1_PORTR|nr:Myotubularin-related protein 13 [Portunus trituberculatus]